MYQLFAYAGIYDQKFAIISLKASLLLICTKLNLCNGLFM